MEKSESKSTIRLRSKSMKNGGQSLYLDIYHLGVRRYEFLHLYLLPETSREAKVENRNTMRLAEAIKSKRIVECQNGQFGFSSFERVNMDFYEYLERLSKASQKHGSTTTQLAGTLAKKMKSYTGRNVLPFAMIDKQFILGFLDFLRTPKAYNRTHPVKKVRTLKPNAVKRYYCILNTTLNRAVRDDIIPLNPICKIPMEFIPKKEVAEKSYLTEDELRKLYQTPTKMRGQGREKFLFGCATGLRHSDIDTLRWEDITIVEDGTYVLKKKQVKTGRVVEFPMSKAAIALLPKSKERKGLVFTQRVSRTTTNRSIERWAKRAGIGKHVSFHTSRHTFATLALSKGIDLYTVSKMLGHTNITQTQVYAKILDTSKRKAVELLPTFD